MKIAVVEWWPRLCGAVTWAAHLAGARTEHQVDLLTFSKSGAMLTPWRKVPGPWQVRPLDECASILNGYDLIILSDIVCRAPEIDHAQAGRPSYRDLIMQQLRKLTVPWTTHIHDGSYGGKETVHMVEMLSLPTFCGTLLTTREREARQRLEEYHCRSEVPPGARVLSRQGDLAVLALTPYPAKWVVHPYLPYDLRMATGERVAPGEREHSVMLMGRYSTNKGQDALLDLFSTPLAFDVHTVGYNAYGKPSHAWLMWELATQHLGLTEHLFPIKSKPSNNPVMHKFYTGRWAVRNRLQHVFWYHGAFGDFNEVDFRPWVSLNLTNDGWKGTLEYATLDAIAHGLVAVVPHHQVEYADYRSMITVPYRRCSYKVLKDGRLRQATMDWDRATIERTLSALVHSPSAALETIAEEQHHELATKHDAGAVLHTFLRGLGLET